MLLVAPSLVFSYGELRAADGLHSGELMLQQGSVRGMVTDAATGEPLFGVTVVLKGTTTGVITDAKGQYSLNIGGNQAVLAFSFIGYNTQ